MAMRREVLGVGSGVALRDDRPLLVHHLPGRTPREGPGHGRARLLLVGVVRRRWCPAEGRRGSDSRGLMWGVAVLLLLLLGLELDLDLDLRLLQRGVLRWVDVEAAGGRGGLLGGILVVVALLWVGGVVAVRVGHLLLLVVGVRRRRLRLRLLRPFLFLLFLLYPHLVLDVRGRYRSGHDVSGGRFEFD